MNSGRPVLLILLSSAALVVAMGCKRSSTTSSGPSTSVVGTSAGNSGASSSDGATAVGPGAVNVTGNVVTYQNVHVEVPWNVSDVAAIVKMSQQAATGAGLRLSDGKDALVIASDGRSVQLNGQPYGAVKPGDRVVLTKDGKLTINGIPRSPEGPATKPAN